jgi:hypothetical protein
MNLRVVITGFALIVIAGCFFYYMTTMAPRSTDPVELMHTVGMVSGGVAAIGLVMMAVGLLPENAADGCRLYPDKI